MRTHFGILSRHISTCAIVTVWMACLGGCTGNTQPIEQHGSGGSGSGGVSGTGGSVGTGGATPGTGGSVGSGGTTAGTGGATTGTGGTMAGTGGRTTGIGGTTAGTGGRTTGTGGSTPGSGGSATGGSTTQPGSGGTTSATGGRATGGATTGTTSSGGNRTGGTAGGTGGTTGGSTGTSTGAVKSPGCGTATTAKSGNDQTISVGGTSRTYNLKIPDPYDMNNPYRLIVSYHWMGGTAANVSDGSGTAKAFYGLWDLAGGSTIFVAPQGNSNQWANSGGADVDFSRTLITQLESQLCIDTSRIFCEGFSMGGSMSYAMACAMGDVIRGVAVHSGGPMSGCVAHTKPVPYFMTHGTKDSVCTYPAYGVPQLQDFAKVDGCKNPDPTLSATAFEAALPEPTSTASACVDFTGCQAGYPVRACLFVGDHTPSPDGTNGWVPKESWKFISQF